MSTTGTYEPKSVEAEMNEFWEQGGYFHAEPDPERPAYSIVIPPPNVTGALHLGHAVNNTLQDILIRRKRMQGYNACWLPGTDHAGIATQAVVEKRLRDEQGWVRDSADPEHREYLVGRIWEWKEEYNARILGQLRKLGCSCDWRRTRFTLDETCARAVYEMFFRLFKQGLIFRGQRLVNWDAQLQTAVADDEVYHETVKSSLWHIRYPLEGIQGLRDSGIEGKDYLVVATTRPETMLGDTAIAVHPKDERFKHLIGGRCILPLMNRSIPIIADGQLVDPKFGTGCVKVTPAHDPNDYECGLRHGLPMINVMTPDGKINENGRGKRRSDTDQNPDRKGGASAERRSDAGTQARRHRGTQGAEHDGAEMPGVFDYVGLPKERARKQVVADLETLGLLEKIEPYETEVGHSDRSKTPIEPLLSEQWFVKMASLAESAMETVRDRRVRFFPERFAKSYLDWLSEKRDWCISRQLWWGHRIPVWSKRIHLTEDNWIDELMPKGIDSLLEGKWDDDATLALRVIRISDGELITDYKYEFNPVVPESEGEYDFLVCSIGDDGDTQRLLEDAGFEQDPDVLDTWFSSSLWPFSTWGWPECPTSPGSDKAPALSQCRTPEQGGKAGALPSPAANAPSALDYFYPTNVLSTARDIISLWVARMVMTSVHLNGRVPFQHVLIHPTILDGRGKRMSKTAGNGLDPLDLIEHFGTDAMRYVLASLAGDTQDVRIPVEYLCPHCGKTVPQKPKHLGKPTVTCDACEQDFATRLAGDELTEKHGLGLAISERFTDGRKFCNKLWQVATGFVLPNLEGSGFRGQGSAVGVQGSGSGDRGSEDAAPIVEDRPLSPDEPTVGGTAVSAVEPLQRDDLALEDRWILSRLTHCIAECDRRLGRYQFSEQINTLYSFFWSDFCDWYVELVKPRLYGSGETGERRSDTDQNPDRKGGASAERRSDEATERRSRPAVDTSAAVARQVLAWVLDQTLRLLHPITPFITEKLWRMLNDAAPLRGISEIVEFASGAAQPPTIPRPPQGAAATSATIRPALCISSWPAAGAWPREPAVEQEMRSSQDVIRALREIRTDVNALRSQAQQKGVRTLPRGLLRASGNLAAQLTAHLPMLKRLGQCDEIEIVPEISKPAQSISKVLSEIEVYVPLAGLADTSIEQKRLTKQRDELTGNIARIEGKLANEQFVENAPTQVVERERSRLVDLRTRLETIERHLAEIGG